MRKPSVLFLNRVYPPHKGATGRVLKDLAQAFARDGWDVSIITTAEKSSKQRDQGVRVIRLKGPEKPSNIFSYMWVLLRLLWAALRHSKTDLVVTMSDPPFVSVAGQVVKRFKGARHIHWCQDLYPDIFPALGVALPRFIVSVMKNLSRKSMLKADKVIVIGRCMAQYLSRDGIPAKHMSMIPNWPDFELMRSPASDFNDGSAKAESTALRTMDIEGAKPFEQQYKQGPKFRILYAGNLGQAHPIDAIIQAAEILNEQHPEIEFVFAGGGSRFDELGRERTKRHLDNIRLMPYQPAARLRDLMESGDVHLISVANAAAGMLVPCKLYSALAVQRPCIYIGPAKSEAAKVIKDFEAGVVVRQGQGAALAEEIKRLRLNSDDWFAAQKGAAEAGQVFVPKDAIEAWIERAQIVVEHDLQSGAMGSNAKAGVIKGEM